MKVYTVMYGYDYEGDYLLGVYASPEGAQAAAASKHTEWPEDEDDESYEKDCDYVEVREVEVQP